GSERPEAEKTSEKAEKMMWEGEEWYRTVFETTGTATVIIEEDTTLSRVNTEFEKLCGYPKEEVEGKKSWTEFVLEEDLARMKEYHRLRRVNEKAAPRHYEFRFKDRYGRVKNIFLTIAMIPGTKKSVASLLDITELKKAERMRRESEEKYRKIFEVSPSVIVLLDGKGNILDVNPRICDQLGYKPEEIIGKNFAELPCLPEKSKAIAKEKFLQRLKGKESPPYDLEFITKSGEKRVGMINATPMIDARGKIVGDLVVVSDITERKRMEEQLIRLSNAVKISKDSIVISDIEGRIVDVNAATLKMYGTDNKEDLIGKSSFDLIAPEDREKAVAGMQETLEKGYIANREYHVITKNGNKLPIEMSVALMKDADGEPIGFVGISRDITERKQAEKLLKESEKRFRLFLRELPYPVVVVNPDTSIEYVNPAFERLTGFRSEEVVGLKPPYPWWIEETMEQTSRDFGEAMQKGVKKLEELFQRKDGKRFWVEITGIPIKEDGRLKYYLSSWVEVTERKKTEEELREAIRRAELLRDILVHDISNINTIIVGYLNLLEEVGLTDQRKGGEIIAKLEQNFRRMTRLIENVQKLRMLEIGVVVEPQNLESIITETIKTFGKYPGKKVLVEKKGEAGLVLGSKLLPNVFENVLDNAIKYSPGKEVRVEVNIRSTNGEYYVEISDWGPGIPDERKETVFQRLDLGRSLVGGSGMGWSISKKIVEACGGRIWAEDRVQGESSKGAKIVLTLPKYRSVQR
ncbi:MAG: hypothetical protein DRO11_07970, partial [Methanobacteriota archaeon]